MDPKRDVRFLDLAKNIEDLWYPIEREEKNDLDITAWIREGLIELSDDEEGIAIRLTEKGIDYAAVSRS